MDSASHYRKIDLQSLSDLTYLIDNIKHAAREKIDLAIPPSAAPDGEDAYRTKVEELVNEVCNAIPSLSRYRPSFFGAHLKAHQLITHQMSRKQYIIQTLTLALPSLHINGLDPSPSILRPPVTSTNAISNQFTIAASPTPSELSNQVYDAYDPRLAEQLRTLYATFDDESTKVAELRREAPRAAVRAHVEALEKELAQERELWRDMEMQHEGGGLKVESGLQLGKGLERRDEVEKMWRRGTEGLAGLGSVTEVVARLERAEKALGVVEGG